MRRLLQRKLCRRKTLLFTLFLLSLIIGTTPASAKEVTVTFTMKDYFTIESGSKVVKSLTLNDDFGATFTKGTSDPAYFVNGEAIRVYKSKGTSIGSATITTTNSNYTITSIVGAYDSNESNTYEFTIADGKSGKYITDENTTIRLHHFNITYDDGTTSDTRQDVSLSWSESAVSTNIGETFTAPTLTVNPDKAKSSLVYSSSDKSVAEIANDGTVTIKAVGQTTITVAIPDEDATYKPKSASYTLTVIDPNEVYYLVKTAADFDVTQECILVAYNNKDSYQAAMGKQIKTDKNAYYREAVPYSQIATSLPDQLNAPAGTVPFILEPNDDATAYYIKVGEGKYISVNTGKSTDTKEVAKSSASTVNLTINGTDHKASLKASGGRALGYNNSTNPKRFASYTATDATYNKVYLYQKHSATPALGDITFTPAPGEVTRGTEVTISCNNATQLYYIFSYEETGKGHFVTGNSTTVTITQDCSIEVIATNASSTPKTILVNYTIKAAPICGDITFDPASGSEVEEGSDVSISCENAVKLSYTITKGDVTSEPVEVEGSSTTVSVTEPCTLTVNAVNADNIAATQASASYTIAPKTTYELVEAYNGDVIPDGNYIFASTTANGSFMMKGQEKDYRIADDVTITENKFGAYPRFEITVKKEENGYYSLITNDNNYIYATAERKVAETTETDEGKGKWQPIITGSTMTFNWVNGEENFGSLQMYKNANSERFTTYTSSQAPISLYVITHDLPKISYHFVDGKDEAAFYAENGKITEIRPYLIDGTLAAEALDLNTYPDNAIPFRFSQPRFKVTASNDEYGDTVEQSFSFIQELCNRRGITNGGYTVNIEYVDFNDQQKVASFPLANEEGSLLWEMSGYLVNESDDILDTYPFLIKETYIRLAMSYLNADGPTILNVKIAAPADGGEGVYGAPAHAPATDDLVATKGNYNFVQNGGSHFYFDGQGKNFIKGNIEVSPFEYANIRITSIDDVTTEVSDILDEDAEEVFYNLQGVRVENPDKGIYIRVKGNKTEKILK